MMKRCASAPGNFACYLAEDGRPLQFVSGGLPLDRLTEVSDTCSDEELDAAGGGHATKSASDTTEELEQTDPDELAQVQTVLEMIFYYYSTQGHSALAEPRLTSTRFQRMAMDAALVSGRLTSAKVDVAFRRICAGSQNMTLVQFLDVMVRIANLKYPGMQSRQQAVLRLYREHLQQFSAVSSAASILENLKSEALAVVQAAQPTLRALYDAYFGVEAKSVAQKRPRSSIECDTQGVFVQLLSDFEVTPELCPKSLVYNVFREVLRAREIPPGVMEQVCNGLANKETSYAYTYAHFALCIALLAQRCFCDDSPNAVVRLFRWMDASKGRIVFGVSFPGRCPGGVSNFRITPDVFCMSPPGTRASVVEDAVPLPAKDQARRCSGGSTASGAGASGPRRSATQRTSSPSRVSSKTSVTGEPRTSPLSAPGPGAVAPGTVALAGLPDRARGAIQQTFGHYAALGDPLNRTHMSSNKFGRFLRDCGVVRSAASTSSSSDLVPESRRRNSTGVQLDAHRRNSNGGVIGTVRHESSSGGSGANTGGSGMDSMISGSRPSMLRSLSSRGIGKRSLGSSQVGVSGASQREQSPLSVSRLKGSLMTPSVSPALPLGSEGDDGATTGRGSALPLHVFAKPPLSNADADLVFVQAARSHCAVAKTIAKGGISATGASSTSSRLGSAGLAGGPRGGSRHQITNEGFCQALVDVALRCTPPEHCVSSEEALESFCQRVLEPLNELLMGASGDIALASEVMTKPEAQCVFVRCRAGIEKLFAYYAHEDVTHKACWIADSMVRFATDFEIEPEVHHLTLVKIFQDCAHHEKYCGDGVDKYLELPGFQLALVVLARKLYSNSQGADPVHQLRTLFQRLNTVVATRKFSTKLGSHHEALFPISRQGRSSVSMDASASGDAVSDSVGVVSATSAAAVDGRVAKDISLSSCCESAGASSGARGKHSDDPTWAQLLAV